MDSIQFLTLNPAMAVPGPGAKSDFDSWSGILHFSSFCYLCQVELLKVYQVWVFQVELGPQHQETRSFVVLDACFAIFVDIALFRSLLREKVVTKSSA